MNQEKQHQYLNHFIAGLSGSFISVTVCHPLEVARTRLNLQGATASADKYNGFVHAIRMIFREEGLRGYYNGYRATIVAVPVFHSLFFPIYKWNKEMLQNNYGLVGFYNHLTATVMTGFACDLITNPLWLIRTRMQTQYLHDQVHKKYLTVPQALWSVYREEGLLALYKGFGASVLGLTHVAIYFPIYEHLKSMYTQNTPDKQLRPIDILKASIISKLIAVVTTYPHVVIRTRLHDNRTVYNLDVRARMRLVMIIKAVYQQGGFYGFYRGLSADIIRVLPMNSITFLVYELFSKYLNEYF